MNKFKKIVSVFALVMIVLLGATGCGQSSQNGYTAEQGSTLNVVEDKNDLKFDVVLEDIETNFEFDLVQGVFQTKYGPYTKVDLKITNNSKAELDLSKIGFKLYDEDNKSLVLYSYPAGVVGTSDAKEIAREKIGTGESKTGSLYFANVEDSNKLKKGKLEIKVPYDKKNPYSAEVYNMKINDKVLK